MRKIGVVAAVTVVAAGWSCSSEPAAPDGGSPDAGTETSSGTDAKADAGMDVKVDAIGACNLSKPFETPVALTSVNTTGKESKPRLSPDELTIYFDRDGDIYVATRPTIAAAFAPAVKQPISTSEPETSPSVTEDGTTMFFQVLRADAGGQWDIWQANRGTVSGVFDTSSPFYRQDAGQFGYNTENHDVDPYIIPNGFVLYFATQGGGTPKPYDLVQVQTGWISATQPFANVNDPATEEASPAFTPDELTLYFGSKNRTGGAGDWDIWKSTRASSDDPYGKPVNVTELNSSATDVPGFITSDGCRIYYETTKDGNSEIYSAAKPK